MHDISFNCSCYHANKSGGWVVWGVGWGCIGGGVLWGDACNSDSSELIILGYRYFRELICVIYVLMCFVWFPCTFHGYWVWWWLRFWTRILAHQPNFCYSCLFRHQSHCQLRCNILASFESGPWLFLSHALEYPILNSVLARKKIIE